MFCVRIVVISPRRLYRLPLRLPVLNARGTAFFVTAGGTFRQLRVLRDTEIGARGTLGPDSSLGASECE